MAPYADIQLTCSNGIAIVITTCLSGLVGMDPS